MPSPTLVQTSAIFHTGFSSNAVASLIGVTAGSTLLLWAAASRRT